MFVYFHDTMANLSSELQASLRLDRSCSAWLRSESQRNLQNLVITGNVRASQSRTFLHDDSHTWGKLQPCCTIILSNLTWWHIMFHITWSKLIEELTSSIREKVWNFGACFGAKGIWKTEHKSHKDGGMVKNISSLRTAVLQILLQSLNQDLRSALLLLRGDRDSPQEPKTLR